MEKWWNSPGAPTKNHLPGASPLMLAASSGDLASVAALVEVPSLAVLVDETWIFRMWKKNMLVLWCLYRCFFQVGDWWNWWRCFFHVNQTSFFLRKSSTFHLPRYGVQKQYLTTRWWQLKYFLIFTPKIGGEYGLISNLTSIWFLFKGVATSNCLRVIESQWTIRWLQLSLSKTVADDCCNQGGASLTQQNGRGQRVGWSQGDEHRICFYGEM